MKHYLVDITWYQPYPIKVSYREAGSNFSVAVSRALKKFRTENKGRRIDENIVIRFTKYGVDKSLPMGR